MGFFLDDSSPVIWRGPLVTGSAAAVSQGRAVGRARRAGRRSAARHRRCAAHAGAAGAAVRRRDRDHAAGRVGHRRRARHRDVQSGQHAGARHRREHERLRLPALRHARRAVRQRRRASVWRASSACRCSARFRSCPAIRASGDAGTPIVIAQPEHPVSRMYASIAAQVLDAIAAERAPGPAHRRLTRGKQRDRSTRLPVTGLPNDANYRHWSPVTSEETLRCGTPSPPL